MTISTYQQLCADLGINRGALTDGFRPESEERSTVLRRDPIVDYSVSKRLDPQPLEDLSHLSPGRQWDKNKQFPEEERLRRCHPQVRPLYKSMLDRGVTVAQLAEQTGLRSESIHCVFRRRGKAVTERLISLLKPLLNEWEVGFLGW